MTQLPVPKRLVFDKLLVSQQVFYVHGDLEIFDFIHLLAPIGDVTVFQNLRQARVTLDVRYAYDDENCLKTYQWIVEQVYQEFGNTQMPNREQPE